MWNWFFTSGGIDKTTSGMYLRKREFMERSSQHTCGNSTGNGPKVDTCSYLSTECRAKRELSLLSKSKQFSFQWYRRNPISQVLTGNQNWKFCEVHGMPLALDRGPVATWFHLWANQYCILLAWTCRLSSSICSADNFFTSAKKWIGRVLYWKLILVSEI